MFDACWSSPTSERDVLQFWENNFERHNQSSRAPFPMFGHLSWFERQEGRLRGTLLGVV